MGIWYIRLSLQRPRELLLRQLQERLLQESTTRIEDGRCQGRVWEPLGDLVKRRVDAIAVSDISADANGLAAAGGDLLHDGVIVVRVAGKNHNRIRLGKAPRDRRTLVHVRLVPSRRALSKKHTVPGPTPAMTASALKAIVGIRQK